MVWTEQQPGGMGHGGSPALDLGVGPGVDPGGADAGRGVQGRPGRRRLSGGHVVMIVAGLLAALLTYSVLRQAGGKATAVIVVAHDIRAGDTVAAADFRDETVNLTGGALAGMVRPAGEAALTGQVARVDLGAGEVAEAQDFASPQAQPSRMVLSVPQAAIPGGAGSLQAGSRIDLVGATAAGLTEEVKGLVVLAPPTAPAGASGLAGSSDLTIPIEVAVPDDTTETQVYAITGGRFALRVSDPGLPSQASQPSQPSQPSAGDASPAGAPPAQG